ncbi:MAG: SIS domain-containing protein [Clostridium sp.]|nr:SIS domain-containing protein [Clostridium sp.]
MKNFEKIFAKTSDKVNSIMQKEIFEQPAVVKNLLSKYTTEDNKIHLNLPLNIDNIVIVASGSSYNCAAIAAPLFIEYAQIPCEYEYSSEFILQKKHFVTKNSLYIFVSQSGETSDTLNALKQIKKEGVKTLCITNAQNSTMWQLCDYKILSDAGKEESIASTKALTAQILCCMLIMLETMAQKGEDISGYLNTMRRLPAYLERIKNDLEKIKTAAHLVSKYKNISILGNKNYYPVAKEGALKIKETCYLNVMAYPFGEFMHGHVAVLNQKSIVIAIIDEENAEFAVRNLKKIKDDYNPKIICITSVQDVNSGDLNIYIKTKRKMKAIFGSLITLQLIACELANILRKNPDRPKGLKKVVID